MDSERSNAAEGYRLENLELGILKGKGSIGSVYQALGPDGKTLAVKIMEQTPFIEPLLLESIIKGALKTQKIVEKANVVKIYFAGKTDAKYYIVMDFYRDTLESVINTSFPAEKKLEMAVTLANTLAAVHAAGLVHGDLKPRNVLLDEEDQPFLNDFYHSTIMEEASRKNFTVPQGTPKYMSPEQASGRMISPASDIYSFGVLVYELFTGKLPYDSEASSISEMLSLIQSGHIVQPSKIDRKIDPKLEAVIMKMLHKNIEHRYHNMGQAALDLKACLEGRGISILYKKSLWYKIVKFFHS